MQKSVQGLSSDQPSGNFARLRLAEDPAASFWLMRFKTGCKRRMGQDWRPDEAITSRLMRALIKLLDRRVLRSPTQGVASKWINARAYFVSLYVFSCRRPEGLLLHMPGLLGSISEGLDHRTPYVTAALLGKVKGETHQHHHKMHSVAVTSSGLEVQKALELLLWIRGVEGRSEGPAICNEAGMVWTTQQANLILHELLAALWIMDNSLFPKHIRSLASIRDVYHVFRLFWQGSNSRALSQDISETDVNIINRWAQKEKAKGKKMGHQKMMAYYAQVGLLLNFFLRYMRAMLNGNSSS
jgi:hypothetical protein